MKIETRTIYAVDNAGAIGKSEAKLYSRTFQVQIDEKGKETELRAATPKGFTEVDSSTFQRAKAANQQAIIDAHPDNAPVKKTK